MIIKGQIWLSSVEILADDDPYEGIPGSIQFPHRMWRSIDEVPEQLRIQILRLSERSENSSPEKAFHGWFMTEEQSCIMTQSGRRNFYINCWHAADHESVAMWKIYASPGAGVAIITNGARLETALDRSGEEFHLGSVKYRDPSYFQIGTPNAFDPLLVKRSSFSYENEVRLVYWKKGEFHDALANFDWNEEKMRFDNLIKDTRPIVPGLGFACDLDTMIEQVIVSPFAPLWYAPMIVKLRDQLGYRFPVNVSKLLERPPVHP